MGAQLKSLSCAYQVMDSPWRGSLAVRAWLDVCFSQMQLSGGFGAEHYQEAGAFIQTRGVRPEPM